MLLVVAVVQLLLLGYCDAFFGVHIVNEGHMGVYYRFGKLLDVVNPPGLHFIMPFITWPSQIYIRPQTDIVRNVECSTSDGVHLVFAEIAIGNTLPAGNVLVTVQKYGENYDVYLVSAKIRHQIAVICSNLTLHEIFVTHFHEVDDHLFRFLQEENVRLGSGLKIDFVRMTKPTLPRDVAASYERIASEKTLLKVEKEKQLRLMKESETKKEVTLAKADKEYKVAEEENKIKLQLMEAEEEIAKIQNRMKIAKAQAEGEAQRVALQLEAEALQELLSIPGYLELKKAENLANNLAINFGDSLPNLVTNYPQTNKKQE
eukprot:TRINITY_DN30803_c0_g2_i1.p2 TRINITY_DN30803_c0_g2~~TRINITY_DN30803_c0_g2_i1.p2  ORF type:complete len:317 (+),score=47.21 TRINITY_DN30803_c0_g2_i1:57-1007(+)